MLTPNACIWGKIKPMFFYLIAWYVLCTWHCAYHVWVRDSHLDKEEVVSLELQKNCNMYVNLVDMWIWCTPVTLSIPSADELLLNAEQGAGEVGLSGAKRKENYSKNTLNLTATYSWLCVCILCIHVMLLTKLVSFKQSSWCLFRGRTRPSCKWWHSR